MTNQRINDPVNNPYGETLTFSVNPANNRLTNHTYDAAGDMTSRGTFDGERRLTSSGGTAYLYDGNGRRLRRLESGKKIYYVYSWDGRLLVEDRWTDGTFRDYIYFNGQVVATHDNADYVRFIFKDHLGSTRSVARVSPSGENWETDWETTEVYDYFPYGVPAGATSSDPVPTPERYTGKQRDGNGLDYFGARYYDAGTGVYGDTGTIRWTSADSVTAHPYDPPSLNKYAYGELGRGPVGHRGAAAGAASRPGGERARDGGGARWGPMPAPRWSTSAAATTRWPTCRCTTARSSPRASAPTRSCRSTPSPRAWPRHLPASWRPRAATLRLDPARS